ncbi:hypothetical protein CSB07_01630 [Candidatus Gracilibacteria bacterium]|nr:MAG: hypothetical protein CSB07_01630 [Candidatus Gracilibacteria bacterium]PIE85806.1 MAG: hypothetical protein CSA08_00115 [Candidatus Gracilibacteria bacterium]
MYKIIILILNFFLVSCSNVSDEKRTIEKLNKNENIFIKNSFETVNESISVDNSIISFNSINTEGGQGVRKLIYKNFKSLVVEAGKNLEFLNGINKFSGNELIIHINISVFGIEFLKKLKGIKGNNLHIGIYSDNKEKITFSKKEADIFNQINFNKKEIILTKGEKIGIINCDKGIKKICQDGKIIQ